MASVHEEGGDQYRDEPLGSGHAFLLKWFREEWTHNEAAQHVLWQFVVFYAFLLVGFGFLYLMIRSTSKLREIRKDVVDTLRAQNQRRFDLENYSGMAYGGIA